jgi:hypothetical protein
VVTSLDQFGTSPATTATGRFAPRLLLSYERVLESLSRSLAVPFAGVGSE